MKPENLNMDEITEARRKSMAASLRTIGLDELKTLGDKLFPFAGDPWREKFFAFLDENRGATFHHATADDGVQVVYCHAKEKGIWFLPKSGFGPMQQQGLARFKKIVEGN